MLRFFKSPTLTQAMDGPIDNFSLLRLVLASAVVISHGYAIPTGDNTLEPLYRTTGLRLGEHAVNCFFAISGFLDTMSFMNRGAVDYVAARLLRIVPGFLAAALVTVFGIGAMFTNLPLDIYFRDPDLYKYLVQVLTGFKSAGQMPGVFADNPHPWPLGTIWTLRYELALYGAVLLFGVAGALRSWHVVGACAALLLIAIFAMEAFVPQATRYAAVMLRLVLMFALGSCFYLARNRVPLSWGALAVLAGVAWLGFGTPFYFPALYLAEAYGIFVFAFGLRLPFVSLADRADLSYGIYLYGWPIQQALVALYPKAEPWTLLAPALAVSALVAWASWQLVEAPALRLKAVFAKQRLRFAAGQGR